MDEILTPEEAAAYLKVNPQTVYRGLRSGSIPGSKVGHQWRIRRKDLERYLSGPMPEHLRILYPSSSNSDFRTVILIYADRGYQHVLEIESARLAQENVCGDKALKNLIEGRWIYDLLKLGDRVTEDACFTIGPSTKDLRELKPNRPRADYAAYSNLPHVNVRSRTILPLNLEVAAGTDLYDVEHPRDSMAILEVTNLLSSGIRVDVGDGPQDVPKLSVIARGGASVYGLLHALQFITETLESEL